MSAEKAKSIVGPGPAESPDEDQTKVQLSRAHFPRYRSAIVPDGWIVRTQNNAVEPKVLLQIDLLSETLFEGRRASVDHRQYMTLRGAGASEIPFAL